MPHAPYPIGRNRPERTRYKENIIATFNDLGLSEKALSAVVDLGYSEPTPVQEKAIPVVLEGRDLIAAAKTGTGKTAAFSLPTLDQLRYRADDEGPLMVIVTPTRELAQQIADTCAPIARRTNHSTVVLLGGVGYGPQIKKLRAGADIIIATPGRLLDLMRQGAARLGNVEKLVLDEADRMLDMGFWPQVSEIVDAIPAERQTLLFSATIDRSQDKVMFSLLKDPEIIEIAHRGDVADLIDQYVIKTDRRLKPALLNSFVRERGGFRVIVFTRTKGGADNCTKRLRKIGIATEAIHADRSQAQRARALDNFREGKTHVLVATDVLSRGIDVPEVDYVINYDLPMMPEDYVHRIGRTGRAGARGYAVSFVTPDTRNLLKSIQKFIDQTIEVLDFAVSDDAMEPVGEDHALAGVVDDEKGARGGRGKKRGKDDRGRDKDRKRGRNGKRGKHDDDARGKKAKKDRRKASKADGRSEGFEHVDVHRDERFDADFDAKFNKKSNAAFAEGRDEKRSRKNGDKKHHGKGFGKDGKKKKRAGASERDRAALNAAADSFGGGRSPRPKGDHTYDYAAFSKPKRPKAPKGERFGDSSRFDDERPSFKKHDGRKGFGKGASSDRGKNDRYRSDDRFGRKDSKRSNGFGRDAKRGGDARDRKPFESKVGRGFGSARRSEGEGRSFGRRDRDGQGAWKRSGRPSMGSRPNGGRPGRPKRGGSAGGPRGRGSNAR
ncbi:DEAD/DEAH box helicase [Slackia exigua]|uniref:DEAD/DEAH box helicase n=1 Tax=Slackia exigua TaxID=84109 RepID=UPI003AB9B0BA